MIEPMGVIVGSIQTNAIYLTELSAPYRQMIEQHALLVAERDKYKAIVDEMNQAKSCLVPHQQ